MEATTSDSALRELFEREANDELDGIERLLHRISDADAAAELYRHAHTIKGSAGVMGLPDVAELANVLEEIFDQLRSTAGDLDAGAAEVITAAVADLRYLISCRLNHVEASDTARDARTALLALRKQLEHPARARSDTAPTGYAPHATIDSSDAIRTRLDAVTELACAIAAAQLALMRLLAPTVGANPAHIPEYGQLKRLLDAAIPDHGDRSTPRTALVVDDSPLAREHHRAILAAAGFEVRTARDGTEALTLLSEHQADVVVTDPDIPTLDGIALTHAIRSGDRTSAIPVIIVTSRDDQQTRQRSLAAGAQDVLIKTANADALLSSLARTLAEGQ